MQTNMTQNTNNNSGLGQLASVGVDVQLTWSSAVYIALAGVVIILCFFLSKRYL